MAALLTLGVDVASQPRGTAACWIRWQSGAVRIEGIEETVSDARLIEVIDAADVDQAGLDVPLGWPRVFVEAVAAHAEHRPWPAVQDWRLLTHRETDRWVVQHTRHQVRPLSVSTDRLAYPAMRVARLLGVGDRTGDGRIVEVYPAAALWAWEMQHRRYKRLTGREALTGIVKLLRKEAPWLKGDAAMWRLVERSDHAFDALVSSLVARTHALNLCEPIPDQLRDAAQQEGWIAMPRAGSLSLLVQL